jgi:hypothetical protein
MAVIQVEATISLEQLLKVVAQLPDDEIGSFTEQVIALRARRIAPSLPNDEGDLLQRINQALPSKDLQRYDELVAKRDAETLTPAEHDELLKLSDRYEEQDATRIAALIDLARMRGVALADLMASLEFTPRRNG